MATEFKYGSGISKADEVALLAKFAAQFDPANSYVGMLLGGGLIDWFVSQVQADGWTDLLGGYNEAVAGLGNLRSDLAKAERRVVELGAEVDLLRADLEAARVTAQRQVYVVQSDLITARAEASAAESAAEVRVTGLGSQLACAARVVEERDLEIMRLKARLFDMMEARDES